MKKPKILVAIIGGGIFGATAALILGKKFSVELFEKNADIFGEATWANQYRHHYGFHYPRSRETIEEIKGARKAFEKFYKSAIFKVPSYYCISKKESSVSADDFIQIYKTHKVPFVRAYPPRQFLNRETVSVSIRTPEAVYDYKKLKNFVKKKIGANKNIRLMLGCEIIGAKLDDDGAKILKIKTKSRIYNKKFDYVVNATYARHNNFCGWLNFPEKKLKFRLKEIVLLKFKAKKKLAVTIMDGPFATILPTSSSSDIYTLGDVPLSVHGSKVRIKSVAAENARWGKRRSRWKKIMKRCLKWFPLLKDAEYIKSMFVILPTEMVSEKNDARPTDVVFHGSGCWSIFSGKILTSVSAAKKILQDLK